MKVVALVVSFLVVIHFARGLAAHVLRMVALDRASFQDSALKRLRAPLLMGLVGGAAVAWTVAFSLPLAHSGPAIAVIWYLAGGYMAFLAYGRGKRIVNVMAITTGASRPTSIAATVWFPFPTPGSGKG